MTRIIPLPGTIRCSQLGCPATIDRSRLPSGWIILRGEPRCPVHWPRELDYVDQGSEAPEVVLRETMIGDDTLDMPPEDP